MPRKVGAGYLRSKIMEHVSIATAAATVSADFNANTLATIAGGAGGFTPGFQCEVEKLRFKVGDADFAGGGGTLTFEVRKNSATGTALAQLVIPLASALRGAWLEAAVSAANAEAAKLSDTDKLFLVRLATGTVFTSASGVFEVWARQLPQSRQ